VPFVKKTKRLQAAGNKGHRTTLPVELTLVDRTAPVESQTLRQLAEPWSNASFLPVHVSMKCPQLIAHAYATALPGQRSELQKATLSPRLPGWVVRTSARVRACNSLYRGTWVERRRDKTVFDQKSPLRTMAL
jgi:hypothetical protein